MQTSVKDSKCSYKDRQFKFQLCLPYVPETTHSLDFYKAHRES